MKTFNNIASLVRARRTESNNGLTQEELASLLGFKDHSLIANIEEATCSVPLKTVSKLSEILKIHPEEFKDAVLKDHKESLDRYFNKKFIERNDQMSSTI